MARISWNDLFNFANDSVVQDAIRLIKELDTTYDRATQTFASQSKVFSEALGEVKKSVESTKTELTSLDEKTDEGGQSLAEYGKQVQAAAEKIEGLKGASKGVKTTQDTLGRSVDQLKTKLKGQVTEFRNLQKAVEPDTKALKKLTGEIRLTSSQITALNTATKRLNSTFKSSKGSYNDIVQQNKRLSEILRRLPLDFIKTNKRAQQLQKTLASNTVALKKFDTQIGRNFRNVGNYRSALGGLNNTFGASFGAITGLTLGIAGAALAFRQAVVVNGEYEDSLAQVRKTTDLTKDEARGLGEELKELNTRTTISGLLSIAKAGGRFQVASEDLAAFTKEVDKLLVALGDDLGGDAEQITTDVTKIADVFGLLTKGREAEAISRIGSAINDLGNKTKAQAGFILDFTTRVQGVAATVDLSLPFILGLGAALDELGVTAEVSSTVLNKLFTAIGDSKNFERFSNLLGITVDEFKNLARTSPEKVFTDLLKAANSSEEGFVALDEVLKNLGIDGQRSAQVLTALAANTDKLTDRVQKSTDAYKENTSITKEFEIANETLGASIDKLINAFNNATTSSGIFAKAIKGVIDSLTTLFTLDFEEGFSVITGQDVIEDIIRLRKELGLTTEVATETVEAFSKLSKSDQSRELSKTVELLAKADRELIDLRKELNSLAFQGKSFGDEFDEVSQKIAAQKEIIEALENEYMALNSVFAEGKEQVAGATAATEDNTEAVDDNTKAQQDNGHSVQGVDKIYQFHKKTLRQLLKEYSALEDTLVTTGKAFEDLGEDNEGFFFSEDALDTELARIKRVTDFFFEKQKEMTRRQEDEEERRRKILEEGIFTAQLAVDSIVAIRNNGLQREIESLELQKEAEIAIVGDNDEARAQIEESFNKRQLELRQKQARGEKTAALAQIAIDTAAGIQKAVAASPLTFGLPFSAFVAAQGLLQAGIVASTPIPQFFKGTTDSPEGPAMVGEKGSEIIVTPKGDISRTTKPQIRSLEKGTVVVPAPQTRAFERALSGGEISHNPYVDAALNKVPDFNNKIFNTYSNEAISKVAPVIVNDYSGLEKKMDRVNESIKSRREINVNVPSIGKQVEKAIQKTNLLNTRYG